MSDTTEPFKACWVRAQKIMEDMLDSRDDKEGNELCEQSAIMLDELFEQLAKFTIPFHYDIPDDLIDNEDDSDDADLDEYWDERDPLADTIDLVAHYIYEQQESFIIDDDLRKYYQSKGIAKLSYQDALTKAKDLLQSDISLLSANGKTVLERIKRIHQMRQLFANYVSFLRKHDFKFPQDLIQRYHNLFAYEVAFAYYLG